MRNCGLKEHEKILIKAMNEEKYKIGFGKKPYQRAKLEMAEGVVFDRNFVNKVLEEWPEPSLLLISINESGSAAITNLSFGGAIVIDPLRVSDSAKGESFLFNTYALKELKLSKWTFGKKSAIAFKKTEEGTVWTVILARRNFVCFIQGRD